MDDFMEKMQELMEIYNSGKNRSRKKIWDFYAKDVNIPCGDEVEVFVDAEDNKIKDISFEGKGCLLSQVGASLLIDYIKQNSLSIEEIKEMDNEKIKNILGMDISPTRMKCATLGLRVLKQALKKRYVLSIHPSEKGNIVGVVDEDIKGKYFEEDEKVLDLTSHFYDGKTVTFREVIKSIEDCYTANIVGNKIVGDLISCGKINKKNVKTIQDVSYIHIYKV